MTVAYRVSSVLGSVRLWLERRRGRQQLVRLDAHALHDLGLSRIDALQEGRKPCWRA